MGKLILSTTKDLYKPIEIEIDGKNFQVKRVTREILEKVAELDQSAKDGNLHAAYQQVELLIGKNKVINALDIRQIGKLIQHVIDSLYMPEKELTESEKKKLKAGDEKSPK